MSRRHRMLTPYGSIGYGASDAIYEGIGGLAKALAKSPKGFWDYMTKDIGKEHVEEEERKRQAILANQKRS